MELIHRTGTNRHLDVDLYVDENDMYALCWYEKSPHGIGAISRQELIQWAVFNRRYVSNGVAVMIEFVLGYFPQEEVALIALEML